MTILPRGVLRQMQRLNAVTTGPATIKLPWDVSRLDLRIYRISGEEGQGALSFWRSLLPTIQFYNPQIPISVKRFTNGESACPELRVTFADGRETSIAAANISKEKILTSLIEATGAEQIEPSKQVLIQPSS